MASDTPLYGTVYQQQFVKLTACIRLGASSKHICLLYVLMTEYLFLQTFVMHSRSVPSKEGITTSTYLFIYLLACLRSSEMSFPLLLLLLLLYLGVCECYMPWRLSVYSLYRLNCTV